MNPYGMLEEKSQILDLSRHKYLTRRITIITIALDKIYKKTFKGKTYPKEVLMKLSEIDVISSDYYDIRLDRVSLYYRDQSRNILLPAQLDVVDKDITIFFDYYIVNSKCNLDEKLITDRIAKALDFLKFKVWVEFEFTDTPPNFTFGKKGKKYNTTNMQKISTSDYEDLLLTKKK
jgi:hypothetical protein